MLALVGSCVMASVLVPYLQSEIDQRGWSATDLARKSGITKSNISKLFQNPSRIPQLTTLGKLARALDVPLPRLIALCGFEMEPDEGAPDAGQVAILFETMPELRQAVGSWSQLSEEYRRALVAYADGLRRQQSQS
jgi:transcriptional regulator with XRE-family HTH domain